MGPPPPAWPQGFLPNRRQQRMAGLAAIELAQALQQLVRLPPRFKNLLRLLPISELRQAAASLPVCACPLTFHHSLL